MTLVHLWRGWSGQNHIAQAVETKSSNNPHTKVLYVTCEKFANQFIHAVKNGKGKEFKDVYRTVDLLIIDDICF